MRLVIGYGNTLRGDDALGPIVAALVGERHPDVEVCVVQQLTPELAEPMSRSELSIFVDARSDRDDEGVLCEALEPAGENAALLAHRSCPRSLLTLSQALYGRHPPAWLVTLPAHDFGAREGLSELAARAVPAAVSCISELLGPSRP